MRRPLSSRKETGRKPGRNLPLLASVPDLRTGGRYDIHERQVGLLGDEPNASLVPERFVQEGGMRADSGWSDLMRKMPS